MLLTHALNYRFGSTSQEREEYIMARRLEQQARELIGKNWSKAKLTRTKMLGEVRRIARYMETQGLQRIQDMKTKHVNNFVEHIKKAGMDHGTMANYITTMRKIAKAIGKQNIVARKNKDYGITRAGIRCRPKVGDIEKIHQIMDNMAVTPGQEWMAHAIGLAEAFGLRMKESLMSNESRMVNGKEHLVVKGAKNGRPRDVRIDTPQKREALDALQQYLRGTGQRSIMPPELSLKQAYDKFRTEFAALGGTKENNANFHLLRHHHAQEMAEDGASKAEITNELGHSDERKVAHYVELTKV